MTLECYHYRYNNPKYNDTSCSGSFEDCRQLQVCPTSDSTSGHEGYHCFAAAQVTDNKLDNGTTTQIVKIISAGCWPPPKDERATQCGKECLGYQQKETRYYCCCTERVCNYALRPQPLQMQTTTPPPQSTSHILSSEKAFLPIPVIPFILVFFIVILLAYNYLRKGRPFKFKSNSSSSMANETPNSTGHNFHHPNQSTANNHYKLDNLNTTELNELRNHNDVAVLMPFRSSFEDSNYDGRPKLASGGGGGGGGGSNSNNFYGQPNCTTNFRTNHRDAASSQHRQNIVIQNSHAQNRIIDLNDIRLLEVIGSGRFGRVHRSTLRVECRRNSLSQPTQRNRNLQEDVNVIEVIGDSNADNGQQQQDESQTQEFEEKEIAVKVIPTSERQSWQNELEIFCSTRTKHPNVLDFYGWCANVETKSHWLCIEYASRGSLHHYLKEHTVDWGQFLSIALGIVRGLSHLHDANVVHRDFKSKNVLLRGDLSPCITDFGVAAIMDIDIGSQQKKFLQVGTPRYMSPEILECSIVFGIKNFMKIDIYAAALVIWELLTRCYPLPIMRTITSTALTTNVSNNKHNQTLDEPMMCDQGDGGGKLMNCDEIDSAPAQMASVSNLNDNNDDSNNNNNKQDAEQNLLLESTTPPPPPEWQEGPLPYKLPYEDYVGSDPDIDTMRNIVCKERLRPPLRPEWEIYPVEPVYRSLKESWEYDEDARVSATCFVERIERLYLDHKQHEAEIVRSQAITSAAVAAIHQSQ